MMNTRTNITLHHLSDVNGLIEMAKRSHGPVMLMDGDTPLFDLREDGEAPDLLRALARDGGLSRLRVSVSAQDMPVFLYYLMSNAA